MRRLILIAAIVAVLAVGCEQPTSVRATVTVINVIVTVGYKDAAGNVYSAQSNVASFTKTTRPTIVPEVSGVQTGSSIDFTLKLTNSGNEPAKGIALAASGGLTQTLPAVNDIPAGGSQTLTWTATIP